MISIEAHRDRILAAAQPLPPTKVHLDDAFGLVLAEDVATRWPVPLFDNSAMDGYAVRAADAHVGARLKVTADVPAGSAADPRIREGEAVRIMTGAPVPSDADAIVPVEHTEHAAFGAEISSEGIVITREPALGAHIRRQGEDSAAGTVVVPAGAVIGPWQLAAIASAGHGAVAVHPAPRAAVISTGTELIPPGVEPKRGQIPESNSRMLVAALREAGAEVVHSSTVSDDEDTLRAELAGIDADIIVLSGGASVGAFDVVKAVLEGIGTDPVRFVNVAMQPGKPQGFGVSNAGALLVCLPGNPVSAAVSFEMFVRCAVRKLAGNGDLDRERVTLPAGREWATPPARTQILPVVIVDGRVWPAAAGGSGSHLVASLAGAKHLAIIPAEVTRVQEADPVTIMRISEGQVVQ